MNSPVSVVVPVFNEAPVLDELVARCLAACEGLARPYELILVDDGSSDGSRERIEVQAARHPGRVKGVFLNRNYGQHNAVICGMAQSCGKTVVTLDADLQNPPEEIGRLMEQADQGFDVVGTIRRARKDSIFRRTASHFINKLVERSTGVAMHDYGCMLRAYDRRVVNAILECQERSTFVPVLANCFARRTTEIEVDHAERKAGVSKYGLMRLIHLMFDLTTTMTTAPLRWLSILGGFLCLLGSGFGVTILVLRLVMGAEWAGGGVFTLLGIAFLFLGAQFLGLGLLGEYLARVQIDVRARPRYFVDSVVGTTAFAAPAPSDGVRAPLPHPVPDSARTP